MSLHIHQDGNDSGDDVEDVLVKRGRNRNSLIHFRWEYTAGETLWKSLAVPETVRDTFITHQADHVKVPDDITELIRMWENGNVSGPVGECMYMHYVFSQTPKAFTSGYYISDTELGGCEKGQGECKQRTK